MSNPTSTLTRTWTCILFDLDGTITDSAPGITKTLSGTLAAMGLPAPSPTELVAYVGPPLRDTFRELAQMDEEQYREALAIYRTLYAGDGAFDSAVYPGMRGLLKRLHESGVTLAVATSKVESEARRILEHFGLAEYFTVVCGSTPDESRSEKADVVAEALRRLAEEGADLAQIVMVGDRHHDILGAAAHDVPAIMVEWGYGSPAEATGAMAVVHSTDQLGALLLGQPLPA